MKKRLVLLLILAFALSLPINASAGLVGVFGDRYDLNVINNFYDNLPGHDSSILTSLNNLSGINLLWMVQPADPYTAAELDSMKNYLTGGGRIAFMGEHGSYAPNENLRINDALSFFGSGISIINEYPDAGFRSASKLDGQIVTHSLTTGVDTYQYACFAPLIITGNGQALMYGEEDPTDVMMGYENLVGGGSIFLITDQNVWDNSPNWTGFNNGRMFENLLTGDVGPGPGPGPGPKPVPEPTTILLLGAGLIGLAGYGRKKLN